MQGLVHSQERLLHHVLGVAGTAEPAVGDGKRLRSQLAVPGLPRSMAATVADAASVMCTSDHTPPPSPTIGNFRLRICSAMMASGAARR
ncbi:MAG TPA: hypothetical protein VFX61_14970 [Micromonosporaceae bacterium]|nr:hypothetical protein [Micromonosporaceae bacterium]